MWGGGYVGGWVKGQEGGGGKEVGDSGEVGRREEEQTLEWGFEGNGVEEGV